MNQLNVVSFNGQLVTDSRDVAEMVGKRHTDLLRSIDNYSEILLNAKMRSADFFIENTYKDSSGKENKCYLLTRKGCDMVANKMTGEKGILFTATYVIRFEEMEQILSQASSSSNVVDFEKQLIGVKYAIEILRTDESSKVRMLTAVHEQHGVPTNHLPVYVENEELKKPISDLLKEHNVGISAIKANNILIAAGILEIKHRPSSKGGTKAFKSITEKGQYYGSNAISPRNPKETQPLYYPSKFSELIPLLLGQVKEVS
ncbi:MULTISPECIES: Rha family transcriptional regulator [unclassified Lysinibacillus]|uniref:Rha family transcriptional regulator n=1 Tax=unclassified Lysinibacillus TaxID=2636778 RepID=UPI003813C986